ncbi:MAG: rubrerythrin family protein [Promethearchaeota archaeon]
MNKTLQNLMAAFAGESQANRKYLAFAKKADEEGFPQVAKLFRAAAAAETVHAHNHLKVANGIRSTKENLAAAIEGEAHEFKSMYPEFIKHAESEAHKDAIRSFTWANKVEEGHHDLYEKAKKAVDAGDDLDKEDIYVCPVCGYTAEGEAPDKCPVCGAAKKVFMKIE